MATIAVQQDRKNKSLAAIITLLIHAAILLFFILYIIITPIPPYPEPPHPAELVLDFGGGGGSPSSSVGNSTVVPATAKVVQAPPASNSPTINNNAEPSTPIPSNTAKVQPKHIDTVPKPPQPSIELANAESKFKHAKASSGGNTGSGGDVGQGGTGGGPGKGVGTGPGAGVGSGDGKFGFNLAGRQLLSRPSLVTNNPEQGQIVVGITVDQDGNVTEATPGVQGTTLTDAALYESVKVAALKTKFNKGAGDMPEQYGTITFKFYIQ